MRILASESTTKVITNKRKPSANSVERWKSAASPNSLASVEAMEVPGENSDVGSRLAIKDKVADKDQVDTKAKVVDKDRAVVQDQGVIEMHLKLQNKKKLVKKPFKIRLKKRRQN